MAKKKQKPISEIEVPGDIRQDKAWEYYINPKSETFGNAYRSALRANYSNSYSVHITTKEWWGDKVRKSGMLAKAEKVLNEDLELETVVPVIGMFGPVIDRKTKKPVMQVDSNLRNIRQKSATFISERLGKKKGWSSRTEITGEDGAPLPTPILGGTAK